MTNVLMLSGNELLVETLPRIRFEGQTRFDFTAIFLTHERRHGVHVSTRINQRTFPTPT